MTTQNTGMQVSDALKENYNTYYTEGERAWRELSAKYKAENIIAVCSAVAKGLVADIGAGEGAVDAELVGRGFSSDIHCLEISDTGIQAIEKRGIEGVKEIRKFDGYRIPYPDRHFSLAFASHVLEHVEHERLFLYEAARVCEYLYIEVPLGDTCRLLGDFTPDRVGHINYYRRKTVRRLIQTCGLEIVDQRLFPAPLDVLQHSSGRLKGTAIYAVRRASDLFSARLAAKLFVYHCGVLCRRPEQGSGGPG